ncbi:MAG: sulfurtransferase [Methanotrichaceae archaeon]
MGIMWKNISSVNKRQHNARKLFIVSSLLIALTLNILLIPVVASTETGTFCCDCPDYSSPQATDAWLKMRAQLCNNMGELKSNSSDKAATQANEPKEEAYPRQELLTSPESKLDKFAILDTRPPGQYASGHIPGARNLYWKSLEPDGMLDPAAAENALCKLGINNSDSILIYGSSGDDSSVYSVFWALSYLGHKNLSTLYGGIDSAIKAGIKLDRSMAAIERSNYTIHLVPWLLVNESTLPKWLEYSSLYILDARDWVDYGKSRLTGASLPLDVTLLYDNENNIKDAATIKDILDRHGLVKNRIQMAYGTPQAYSLFFILRLMDYNATLLEGDWWQNTKWASNSVN